MAKTRLNVGIRDRIYGYMAQQHEEGFDHSEAEAAKAAALEKVNAAIRKKYPEKDMAVLRKYNCTRFDSCVRLMESESGRVFGFVLDYSDRELYCDIPTGGGCHRNEAFEVSAEDAAVIEAYEPLKERDKKALNETLKKYRSFVNACRYLEDVLEVVPLPAELLEKIRAKSSALVAINDDVIASIKSDFAENVV